MYMLVRAWCLAVLAQPVASMRPALSIQSDETEVPEGIRQTFNGSQKPGVWLYNNGMLGTAAYNGSKRFEYVSDINGTPVLGASGDVVSGLWFDVETHSSRYYVEYTDMPPHVSLVYISLGAVPACILASLACCALPCFWWRVCRGTALEEAEKAADEQQEPVPRLKASTLAWIIEHPVTRYSLFASGLGDLLVDAWIYRNAIFKEPVTSCMVLTPHVCLAMLKFIVPFGVKATEGNQLLEPGMMCPEGTNMAMQKHLRRVLFFNSFAFVQFCGYALLAVFLIVVLVLDEVSALQGGFAYHKNRQGTYLENFYLRHVHELLYGFITAPKLLVVICIPYLLLKSQMLARVVEAKVRAVTQLLEHVHSVEREQEGKGISELKMEQTHKACVRLAHDVLPNLQCLAGPTLALAITAWAWGLSSGLSAVLFAISQSRGMETSWSVAEFCIGRTAPIIVPTGVLCLLQPAAVSDAVLGLLDSLNRLRSLEGPADDSEIERTERFLLRFNRGQGLGFTLLGIVITTRLIFKALATIVGVTPPALSFLAAALRHHQTKLQALFGDGE